ncbi:uncharacterized protein si:dkey-29d8.3 [Lampris incognitus]|uniref:uncharacterized protein si:dkey-29d8.3 n=1 Tax=Lampris incognitus TaxID=2546036 RepID=UPI0024B4D77A|nr:uncharacterized protein si:dkey-29d8.3 [Lampris incognitus]
MPKLSEANNSRLNMDKKWSHVIVIVLSAVFYVAVLVVNALAGTGTAPFHSTTGNVSGRYETDITPAGWTFSIWGIIYTWLTLIVLYIITYVFRGSWSLCLLPYGFYASWIANMLLNMTWLLLWDRELMMAALAVLALVAVSNYSALFFCCYTTDYYGLWLQMHHPKDLALLRILVQNGLALYTTWTSIATLINFSLVLNLWGVAKGTAGTVSLCILLVELLGWSILEFVLDRWVRSIMMVYPVVILALVGNITKHCDPADPSPNCVFMVVLLVISCILLVARVIIVICRNRKQPLYKQGSWQQVQDPGL